MLRSSIEVELDETGGIIDRWDSQLKWAELDKRETRQGKEMD